MKTYLMDSLNRYKRFSEKLDAESILCNKSWWVFNDTGEKEIYIFQEDGTAIASLNGNVTMANWKYLPVNKSLIINTNDQCYMFHPAFSDNNILALQKDGTQQYSFMIIEEQLNHFKSKTLSDLYAYFEKQIQEQTNAEQRRLEEEKKRQIEEERKRKQEEEIRQIELIRFEEEREKFRNSFFARNYVFLCIFFSILQYVPLILSWIYWNIDGVYILIGFLFHFICFIVFVKYAYYLGDKYPYVLGYKEKKINEKDRGE